MAKVACRMLRLGVVVPPIPVIHTKGHFGRACGRFATIYMWWSGTAETTIPPWSGRPGDRLPSSVCRYGTRHDKPRNCWYFETNNKPNDNANNYWNEFRNSRRFRLRLRFRYRQRLRLR